MAGPPDAGGAKNAIQARASTITYLERYTLKAICGVAEQGDDSDGNHGGERMNVERVRDHLAAIDNAADEKALMKAFGAAWKAAESLNDIRHAQVRRAQGSAEEGARSQVKVYTDIEQGTPEWFALRINKATASEFSAVLAKGQGKTRAAYLKRVVAEALTGKPIET
jgi:hypothetical protein